MGRDEYEDEDLESDWEEPEQYPVAGIYLDVDQITAFLEIVGATSTLEISNSSILRNPQFKPSWWHGRRESKYTVQRDWDIAKFDQILESEDGTSCASFGQQ